MSSRVDGHARADYTLERGMWRAVCKGCGWWTTDGSRRRAAARFRGHHREVIAAQPRVVVDLRVTST